MREEIKRLLDSENEDDNAIGWELIEAEGVPFKEVVDYVNKTKIPTSWAQKYIWNGSKFEKNPYLKQPKLGGTLSAGTELTSGGSSLIWNTPYYGTSTSDNGLKIPIRP